MAWIDEQYAKQVPNPPQPIKLAIALLAAADTDGVFMFPLAVAAHAQRLIDVLSVIRSHLEWRDQLDVEMRDSANDEMAYESTIIDSDGDSVRGGITRGNLEFLYVVTLIVRLRNMWPPRDAAPQAPSSLLPPITPPDDAWMPIARRLALVPRGPGTTEASVDRRNTTRVLPVRTEDCDPRDGDGWPEAVAHQGVHVTYDGYTQSTHFELLRAERITGHCQRCHRAGRTQLHHVSYERLGAELPEDTRELCDRCHLREHPRTFKKAA